MNTDVQRNHRIVVGAGVALIAVAGISTVALNVHRAVNARTSAAATPPVAIPDTSAPQVSQTPESAPPPIADSPVSMPQAQSNTAPVDTAPQASSAQPSTSSKAAPAPAHRRSMSESGNGPSIASSGLNSAPNGETAVVSSNRKVAADQTFAARSPAGAVALR